MLNDKLFLQILCDFLCWLNFDSIDDTPSQPPSSPLKSKPENVRMFRRSNRTIYTAGKLKNNVEKNGKLVGAQRNGFR